VPAGPWLSVQRKQVPLSSKEARNLKAAVAGGRRRLPELSVAPARDVLVLPVAPAAYESSLLSTLPSPTERSRADEMTDSALIDERKYELRLGDEESQYSKGSGETGGLLGAAGEGTGSHLRRGGA
jgi:hypothetical protein